MPHASGAIGYSMKLGELLTDSARLDPRSAAIEAGGVAVDSRAVKPGDVFFALAGSKTDGSAFAAQAAAAGAVAIVAEKAPPRFPNFTKRLGAQYPQASEAGGVVMVIYSVNQESIEVARMDVKDIR